MNPKNKNNFLALACVIAFTLCNHSVAAAQDKLTINCTNEALSEVAIIKVVNDQPVAIPVGNGKCSKGGSLTFNYTNDYDWGSGYIIQVRRQEHRGTHYYGGLYKQYGNMEMPKPRYTMAILTPGTGRDQDLETSFNFLDDLIIRIRNHRNPR